MQGSRLGAIRNWLFGVLQLRVRIAPKMTKILVMKHSLSLLTALYRQQRLKTKKIIVIKGWLKGVRYRLVTKKNRRGRVKKDKIS
jgi:hypothetical protein